MFCVRVLLKFQKMAPVNNQNCQVSITAIAKNKKEKKKTPPFDTIFCGYEFLTLLKADCLGFQRHNLNSTIYQQIIYQS